ncbi:MAG: hydrogenase maturation protease [Candidatus Thiodiazotropha sp. (ex Dulcina madagascariensis)]|nr:hydrogenase maturation protease [Candidatus Thiodiazotropha sp. (ex Dulcina madagascariensis)]MCU7926982.1 hydrogenase maturation protease [Candidatus Thiodiazotropha sp. (ex Dulcina madagascariensis)]
MIRVIGVGSPFGADRLGWLAIDYLESRSLPDCELIKLDRPGPALLDYFRGKAQVVLIDAVRLADSPGGVALFQAVELERLKGLTSSHGLGVAEAVGLATQLGELPERLCLIGIQAGEDLSQIPPLDAPALETLVRRLL